MARNTLGRVQDASATYPPCGVPFRFQLTSTPWPPPLRGGQGRQDRDRLVRALSELLGKSRAWVAEVRRTARCDLAALGAAAAAATRETARLEERLRGAEAQARGLRVAQVR